MRLDDDGDRREPWVFELGDDGMAFQIKSHSGYMTRVE